MVEASVVDPDPEDPYVFGPPGSRSGSVSQRYCIAPEHLIYFSIR